MTYNYERFSSRFYSFQEESGLAVGEVVPDLKVALVTGEQIALRQLINRMTVLETGSLTCPLYRSRVRGMAEVAETYKNVQFLVLYVREAHPGEKLGAHRNPEDKRRAASRLSGEAGETRTIIIDDIEGTLHRALGAEPDMVFILDSGGVVKARVTTNDPDAVENYLSAIAGGGSLDQVTARFMPPRPRIAVKSLMTGGWLALLDFLKEFPSLVASRFGSKKSGNEHP